MPELPEVESFRRRFAGKALRRTIAAVEVRDARILGVREEVLRRATRSRMFDSVRRHGKHLFASIGNGWVHFHFGMSGDFSFYRDPADEPRFGRLIFRFRDGSMAAFEDMRLFGVVDLTSSPEDFVREHDLGPDPLTAEFTLRRFRSMTSGKRGAIKSLLLSQDVIAGVGNLYADEALFHSSIHPARKVDRITEMELRALHTSIRRVLELAVRRRAARRGLPPRWLMMHREVGERCPRCAGTIARTVVFGRTTYYCARHQR